MHGTYIAAYYDQAAASRIVAADTLYYGVHQLKSFWAQLHAYSHVYHSCDQYSVSSAIEQLSDLARKREFKWKLCSRGYP